MGDSAFMYITGARTSNAAWSALTTMFECKDGKNIKEHICMMSGYLEELAALGSEITNEDFSITLLTSLPDSWDPFISAINSVTLKESHKLITHTLEEDCCL
ncbi:hypothetical protein DXG03_007299 [Asterophora parasitica]|uniref:Zinc finger, CCHC-type n=1 Tax=Asterophora parasitica TaxID=117018 RepID=A0A9P7K327_9AGAR|nr:hypothetical protein DXG03_007299 [Asterophora parasitica]